MFDHEPWYAFMDGPRDQTGQLRWPSPWAALLWAVFTLAIILGFAAIVWLVLSHERSLATWGFICLLLVALGRLILASLVSCVMTLASLFKMLREHQA